MENFKKIFKDAENVAQTIAQNVPYKKSTINYETYKSLHDNPSNPSQKSAITDPTQKRLLPSILTGLISKNISIPINYDNKNFTPSKPTSSNSQLPNFQDSSIHESQYDSNFLNFKDYMFDSKLSFSVPLSYLKIRLSECVHSLEAVYDIGSISNSEYNDKINNRKFILNKLIEYFNLHINYITNFQANPKNQWFRPALCRKTEEYRFIPANLSLNRFSVTETFSKQSDGNISSTKFYDTITFGVSADHIGGYKSGLLKYYCDVLNTKRDKVEKKDDSTTINTAPTASDIDRTNSNIKLPKTPFHMNRHSKCIQYYLNLSSLQNDLKKIKMYFSNKIYSLNNEKNLWEYYDKVQEILQIVEDEYISNIANLFSSDCLQFLIFPKIIQEMIQKTSIFTCTISNNFKSKPEPIILINFDTINCTDNIIPERNSSLKSSNLVKVGSALDDLHDVAEQVLRLGISCLYLYDIVEDNIIVNKDKIDDDFIVIGSSSSIQQSKEINPELATLQTNLKIRQDVIFSQILSAATLGITMKILDQYQNSNFWKQILQFGILLNFETYVSTWRAEQAMLEDHSIGVLVYLKYNVKIKIVKLDEKEISGSDVPYFNPAITGTSSNIIINIPLPESIINQIIAKSNVNVLQMDIKLVPILFNVGINEEQAFADKLFQSYPQSEINYESGSRLIEYYRQVYKEDWSRTSGLELLKLIEKVPLVPNKHKDVSIQQVSQKICRELNAVRFIQCKSAKDRTSMAVTLEQTRIMIQNHNLSSELFNTTLDLLRKEGLGLTRCFKNTGKYKYAFNALQISTFPRDYKPPKDTYASGFS